MGWLDWTDDVADAVGGAFESAANYVASGEALSDLQDFGNSAMELGEYVMDNPGHSLSVAWDGFGRGTSLVVGGTAGWVAEGVDWAGDQVGLSVIDQAVDENGNRIWGVTANEWTDSMDGAIDSAEGWIGIEEPVIRGWEDRALFGIGSATSQIAFIVVPGGAAVGAASRLGTAMQVGGRLMQVGASGAIVYSEHQQFRHDQEMADTMTDITIQQYIGEHPGDPDSNLVVDPPVDAYRDQSEADAAAGGDSARLQPVDIDDETAGVRSLTSDQESLLQLASVIMPSASEQLRQQVEMSLQPVPESGPQSGPQDELTATV